MSMRATSERLPHRRWPGAPSIRVLGEWVGDHKPHWRLFQLMLDPSSSLLETLLATVSCLCELRIQRGRLPQRLGKYLRTGTSQSPGFILPNRLFGACNGVHQKSRRLYSTTYKTDFAQNCALCTRFPSILVDLQVHWQVALIILIALDVGDHPSAYRATAAFWLTIQASIRSLSTSSGKAP
jgi:hypothetical protein